MLNSLTEGLDENRRSQPSAEDPTYFPKRLRAFQQGVFGEKSERAVASGGLRPSLLEIAELINQSSSTYREVADTYQELVTAGQSLDLKVLPRLKNELLEAQIEILEQQLVAKHLDQLERQLRLNHPKAVQPSEKKLVMINAQLEKARSQPRKLVRRRRGLIPQICAWMTNQWRRMTIATPKRLRDRRHITILEILDRLPERTQQEFIKTALNTLSPQELYGDSAKGHFGLIDSVLDQIANEDRHLLIDKVLSNLSQEEQWDEETDRQQRSLYENYQSYKTIQQILGKLPNSVKESFIILARRAQVRSQKTGNDINQFREEVSLWFDRSMSRASGVYKRNTKGVALLIGFVLAIVANVDAGFIVNRLSNDEDLRRVVTENAINLEKESSSVVAQPISSDDKGKEEKLLSIKNRANSVLKELALPIGWNPAMVKEQLGCDLHLDKTSNNTLYDYCFKIESSKSPIWNLVVEILMTYLSAWLRILCGWLITGIAISMGAAFWFDLLDKFVNVRNSGGKPPSTDSQAASKTSGAETPFK